MSREQLLRAAAIALASSLFLAGASASGMALHASEVVTLQANAEQAGLSVPFSGPAGIRLEFRLERFTVHEVEVGGRKRLAVSAPGLLGPAAEGLPSLPGLARILAVPCGAIVRVGVETSGTHIYSDVDIAPVPQAPTDGEGLTYVEDPGVYSANAYFPPQPVAVSRKWRIRGIDVVTVRINPFQYNPVTRTLVVHELVRAEISFEGGTGAFGDPRLRSRHWEPLLRSHLLNYDALGPGPALGLPDSSATGFEYVIICPDAPEFLAWADTLKAWRTAQGISTEVFTTTEIGGSDAATIEGWLDSAYVNWAIPPAAFLILGDQPQGPEDVGIEAPIWNGYCLSDNIYADVDGDDLPDMAHGRITARNAAELEETIGKMLSYERHPPTEVSFYDSPLLAGGWQDDRWFILAVEIVEGFQKSVLGKNPHREYGISWGNPDTTWSTNPNTYMILDYFGPDGLGYVPETPQYLTDWSGSAEGIADAINSGTFFVLHRDHGEEDEWCTPEFTVSDVDLLHNDLLPFVFSINCKTGRYDYTDGPCLTEAFHRRSDGALGLIAATAVSFSFVNDEFLWGIMDAMWPWFDPGYGDTTAVEPDLRTAFAHISGKYYLEAHDWAWNPEKKPYTYHLYHHHGDAFMTIYSEVPESLDVVHDDLCAIGADSFVVAADSGAFVALTVGGEIIGTAVATGFPEAIPITPQGEPGELRIVVTKVNHFRYDSTVPIDYPPLVVSPDGSGEYPTIQAAIDAAEDGRVVELTDGVFTGEGNRDLDFLGKAIILRSASGDPGTCIIDCEGTPEGPHRGFVFHHGESGTSLVQGITIRHGYAPAKSSFGGGVLLLGSSPAFSNCVIESCYAATGAGVFADSSSATLSSCTLSANEAHAGGALALADSSEIWLHGTSFLANTADSIGGALLLLEGSRIAASNCTLESNLARLGGAAFAADSSSLDLQTSIMLGNHAVGDSVCPGLGGGVFLFGASGNFIEVTFERNAADSSGGGLFLDFAQATIRSCIFDRDSASAGGAISLLASSPHIIGCTLYGNTGASKASGIYLTNGSEPLIENTIISFGEVGEAVYCEEGDAPCVPTLSCCDVYGNAGGDWVGCIEELRSGFGNFSADPLFCDAAAGDFTLFNNSPCAQEGCGLIGAFPVGCWDAQDAAGGTATARLQMQLWPNPSRAGLRLTLFVPETMAAELLSVRAYDASGRLVSAIYEGNAAPRALVWDGRDESGRLLPTGMYFVRLRAGDQVVSRSVVLIH